MAIDITKMEFHVAARDSQGQPVLVQKPVPEGFGEASPVDRLTLRRRIEREAQEVGVAAAHAIMPARPAGFENWPATSRRAWWPKAEQAAKGNHR